MCMSRSGENHIGMYGSREICEDTGEGHTWVEFPVVRSVSGSLRIRKITYGRHRVI